MSRCAEVAPGCLVIAHRSASSYAPENTFAAFDLALEVGVQLRLWSNNVYPNVGWMAPMGEYTIAVRFLFGAGPRLTKVSTGPFKIDA